MLLTLTVKRLPHRLSKRQSLSATVLFRTTPTQTILLCLLKKLMRSLAKPQNGFLKIISKIINDTNQMWLIQQATLPVRPFGKIHVFCNFAVIFVIVYFCLMMWFSKLYVSWAYFNNYKEVLELCQSTNMVSFLTKHTDANYWQKILKTQNLYTCPLAYNFSYRDWRELVTDKKLQ